MLQHISEPMPLFVLLWTILILLAWIGWGFLLCGLLPHYSQNIDWGLAAAWGMALCIALGGVLNLFALISPGVGMAFVLFGGITWFVNAIHTLNHWTKWKAKAWTQ